MQAGTGGSSVVRVNVTTGHSPGMTEPKDINLAHVVDTTDWTAAGGPRQLTLTMTNGVKHLLVGSEVDTFQQAWRRYGGQS